MKVKFEATFDDLVDVYIRSFKNSKGYDSAKKSGWIITSILVGVIVLALVPSTLGVKLIWGVIGSFLLALIYPYLHQRSLEKRTRKYCQNQMGTDGSFPVEIELSPQGVTYKQFKTQITYDWSAVQDIQVSNDRVDFIFENGSIATVRARAFETPEQQEKFIELANGYCDVSRPV
jgi:hypothetical protein